MRDIITCPSCHARLRLPEEPPPGGMTCPRCLAAVPYEAPPAIQTAPLAAPPRPTLPREAEAETGSLPGRTACPHCGKRVEADWLFCPNCEEPLRQERRRRSSNGADRDAKGDSNGVKVMLTLMTVLGGLGTVWYFVTALGTGGGLDALAVGVGLFLFAALISTGIMFYRTRHEPTKRGFGRVLLGTFTLIGVFLATGCSLALAVAIFGFVVCLAGGMRF